MELKDQTVKGIKWVAVGQLIKYPLQIIISIVIASFLSPKEFGLMAMVTVFTGFASIFIDFGFSSAIIQKKEINNKLLSSVFYLNLVVGLIFTFLFSFGSFFIGWFYEEPKLVPVTIALSFTFFISSLSSVQLALMQRDMNFKILVGAELVAFFVSSVGALLLAYLGYGVWSLVVNHLLIVTITLVIIWNASIWRPSFYFSIKEVKEVWVFGKNLTLFTGLNYWTRNLDNLLIGKFIGNGALGIYSRGYGFVTMPVTQISAVLAKVMFPVLSRVRENHNQLTDIYLKSCQIIALITFPLMAGLFLVAEEFVLLFLGKEWIEMIPVLQVFSLLGAVHSIATTVGWIYLATGNTNMMFKWGLFSSFVGVVSFIVGIYFGSAFSVAVSYTLFNLIITVIPSFLYPFSIIGLSFWRFINSFKEVVVMTFLVITGVFLIGLIVNPAFPSSSLASLFICKVSGGIAIYGALLHLIKPQPFLNLLNLLQNKNTILKRYYSYLTISKKEPV
jgi:O-antigen/teichoic acid export membrane protein